ncbi:hypothetical protein [Kitasatospora sp. NPDC088134]|uniref:hypothetical protein n=1 Tax=Kitasatospora sp. NPDC088134 TaxID=3364071 RepID=UPI00382DF399
MTDGQQQAMPGGPESQSQPAGGQPPHGYGYPSPPPAGYGYPQQVPPPAGAPGPAAVPPPHNPGGFGAPPPQFPAQTPPPNQPQPYLGPPVQGRYGPGAFQNPDEPDWTALADQHEVAKRKRKRTVLGAVALVCVAALAGIVAVSMNVIGKDGKPTNPDAPKASGPVSAGPSGTAGGSATPSAKPSTPEAVLGKASTDTAPMTTDNLFQPTVTVEGRVYTRAAVESSDKCGSETNNGLGAVVDGQNCRGIFLATYLADGAGVTVGVAAFDSKAQSSKASDNAKGNIKVLVKDQVPRFCPDVSKCDLGHKVFGRYAYFTIAGNRDLSPVSSGSAALQATADLQAYVVQALTERGNAALQSAG